MSEVATAEQAPAYIDQLVAALPACSLETLAIPIELRNGTRQWPLVLSCYQLQEESSQRCGQMDLHLINTVNPSKKEHIRWDANPQTVLNPQTSSGILDGKWSPSFEGAAESDESNDAFWFVSAHSTGKIVLHKLCTNESNNEDNDEGGNEKPPMSLKYAGQSELPPTDGAPLCLSVNWNKQSIGDFDPTTNCRCRQVVSTFSDGTVAIYNVALPQSTTSTSSKPEFTLQHSWHAHSLFPNCPAEVWSADFCGDDGNVVVSCADDTKLKFWDVRTIDSSNHNKPILTVSSVYEAGTTCASTHPRHTHVVACGSYDETVALYDVRYLSSEQPLLHTDKLGGGIWRLKWHPVESDKLLVAAMHGGCRVLSVAPSSINKEQAWHAWINQRGDAMGLEASWTCNVNKEFKEHASMAYGADWLVDPRNQVELGASCSFYDKSAFLWDTQS